LYAPFVFKEFIGSGTSGSVCKVFHTKEKKNYAMKVITLPKNSSKDLKLKI
jgi:serine/threonine protein kinase